MSNIYIQEPPTSGKVLLSTTVGDVEVELWSKEAPLAARNFVQLCLEHYYDKTIFHRLVPGFVVQGGDPTGTGFGGESVYGEPFRDELHTRLRFVRRGLLAMANNGEKNTNGSQFFFTLGATPDLEGKHTIFGKVVGDTLFNFLKLGESEVDANERPVFLNKILKTEVLNNPFPDVIPRSTKTQDEDDSGRVESTARATKNYGLLSFGDEAEEEEEDTVAAASVFRSKAKSSHDLANDPSLVSVSVLESPASDAHPRPGRSDSITMERAAVQQIRVEKDAASDLPVPSVNSVTKSSRAEELRREAAELARELTKPREQIDKLKTGAATKEEDPAVAEYHGQMDAYEARRRKKGADREEQILAKLKTFKQKMETTRHESADAPQEDTAEEDGEAGGMNWLKPTLTFEEEALRLAKDANLKTQDWYDIYDPRNPINKRKREKKPSDSKNAKPDVL